MKLARGGTFRKHVKIASEDLSKSLNTNTKNYLISKLLNKSNNKTIETEKDENLGNFRTSVQNIFANDDKKKKAIQYVIKIRKEREKSPQNEVKRALFNNKSEINITNKNIKTNRNINTDLFNLYKEKTINNEYYSRNDTNNFNNSINVTKRYFETMNNTNERCNNPNNIFLNNINNNENYHHKKTPSNNVLKNFQNYSLHNNNYNNITNKKEKHYNMNKIKNKILNIKDVQVNNYNYTKPLQCPTEINQNQNQNQTLYNTQINFNYNTNKRYYVHKNLVYSKLNNNPINPVIKVNNSNSKLLLKQNNSKQKLKALNDNINNVNIRNSNNNIIKELKIFEPKTLVKINTISFSFTNRKSIKNIIIKKQYKFNKDKLKNCFEKEIEIINNKNKSKFNFINEKEMINYIRNNYNEKKIKEMFKINKEEEENINLKEENENLKNEIELLKDENEQCKIELDDIRNLYNDLNKELKIAKEENEKLKDNFINNMIEDENDNNNNNNSSIDE